MVYKYAIYMNCQSDGRGICAYSFSCVFKCVACMFVMYLVFLSKLYLMLCVCLAIRDRCMTFVYVYSCACVCVCVLHIMYVRLHFMLCV